MKKELNDVEIAENLIERIEVVRSFLNSTQRKRVADTYRTHNFSKMKKIKSVKGIIDDLPLCSDYVVIYNPNGNNFTLSTKHLEKILKNYTIALRDSMSLN